MPRRQAHLDGLDADTQVTILGARFDTDAELGLGASVTLTVKGHVVLAGREILSDEETRGVIKIRADLIELT
jgi:hypothetical protein